MSKSQIGLVYAINTIIIVVFEMLLVNFVRRFSLLRTIGWGCFLACLGFGILPLSQFASWVVLGMVIITVGEMFMFPLATGFVAHRSRRRDQGMYMSWYAMTFSVASVFAPLAGSAVYQIAPDLVWYGCTLVGVLVLVGFYILAGSTDVERLDENEFVEPVSVNAGSMPAEIGVAIENCQDG